MESSCYKAEVEKLLKNPPAVDRSSYIATRNKIIVEVIQRLTCACLVHSSRTKSALKRRDGSFTSVQFFMLFSQLIISAAQRAGTIPNTTVGEVQACLNTDADENGWRTLLVRITTANNSLFRLLAAILHFRYVSAIIALLEVSMFWEKALFYSHLCQICFRRENDS